MRTVACLPIALPLLLGGCATGFHAGAPKGAIDVIAHRGASAYAPENTLAAFRLAAEMRADWFELDCRLTGDDQLIILHNDTVDKTTNGKGAAGEMTLAHLRTLDAGSWFEPKFAGERLPTFEEALDLAKRLQIGVYAEIKSSDDDGILIGRLVRATSDRKRMTPGLRREMMNLVKESGTRNLLLTRKVIAAIRDRNMQKQVVIQSFSPVVTFIALAEAPDIRVEFLGSDDKEKPKQWDQFLKFGYLIKTAGFNIDNESLTKARLDAFQQRRKSVAVWTVDEEQDIRRLADWGVDAIITNKPDLCRRVLTDMGKH